MNNFRGAIRAREALPLACDEWQAHSVSRLQDIAASSSAGLCDRGEQVACNVGIVQSGAFAVERLTTDGRRVLCVLFRRGDLVDLRRQERGQQQMLTALTRSAFIRFDEERFDSCIATHSDIAEWVKSQLREQTARLRDHVLDLACKTPTEKVASVIFEFRRWPGCLGQIDCRDVVSLPIARRDISDYIGVRPETLSRSFKELESELLIRTLSRRRIVLSNVRSLQHVASGGRPRHSTRSS